MNRSLESRELRELCTHTISCSRAFLVRLGSRASVRTSLLINSLGLEPGRAKGQSGQGREPDRRNGRRMLANKLSSSASSQHSASSDKESDCLSSGFSSGSGSPDPRQAALGGAQCQRCQQTPASDSDESELQLELEAVKAELGKANSTITTLQEREIKLKARYASFASVAIVRKQRPLY